MVKKLICSECGESLEDHFCFLQCDKCEAILCEGVASGSCWHNHLYNKHEIDWTILYTDPEKSNADYIESLRTEVEKS